MNRAKSNVVDENRPPRFEAKDYLTIIFVAVVGFIYYSRYYNHGFNVGDEGSVVLITARLLAGERPYIDVEPGYGLLWYYPLVLLFKITGVNFIASRIFFMSIALMTSLLAYVTIRLNSGKVILALAASLTLLFVPGTLHKTYIPLIVVANMLCLTWVGLNATAHKLNRVMVWSLVVAMSYHIRPDLGICAGVVLLSSLTGETMNRSQCWRKSATSFLRYLSILVLSGFVVTLPFIVVAAQQGFLKFFLQRTVLQVNLLNMLLSLVGFGTIGDSGAEVPEGTGTTLARAPLGWLWQEGPHQVFAILTYLPIVTFFMIAAIVLVIFHQRRSLRSGKKGDFVLLVGFTALAYSTFPQFCLFRPDLAHLSQFMPGYIVAACVLLARSLFPWSSIQITNENVSFRGNRLSFLSRLAFTCVLISHIGLYLWFGFHNGAGSLALAQGRIERFQGANGVEVWVTSGEKKLFSLVARLVEQHTDENDFVLCFPYNPGFNVMTNRPTFAYKLYVDDARLLRDPGWQRRMVDQIEKEKPPMIIISNVGPNGTEISRFENWATEVMECILSEYEVIESFGRYKFFLRKNQFASQKLDFLEWMGCEERT